MQDNGTQGGCPSLKQIASETSRALAELDADRLQALAMQCRQLSGSLPWGLGLDIASSAHPDAHLVETAVQKNLRERLRVQARDATHEMFTLAKIIEVTQANLRMMRHLSDLRQDRLEYNEAQAFGWGVAEARHGDD